MPLLDDLLGHRSREVRGDRAAQTAQADFVDADDFAVEVDQRAAAVAAEDHGIVADPAHEAAHAFAVQLEFREPEQAGHHELQVADDALGDGLRNGHRRTHRQHRVADAGAVGVAEPGHGQLALFLRRLRSSRITAMSARASVPTSLASISSPSAMRQRRWRALPATWWLVMI